MGESVRRPRRARDVRVGDVEKVGARDERDVLRLHVAAVFELAERAVVRGGDTARAGRETVRYRKWVDKERVGGARGESRGWERGITEGAVVLHGVSGGVLRDVLARESHRYRRRGDDVRRRRLRRYHWETLRERERATVERGEEFRGERGFRVRRFRRGERVARVFSPLWIHRRLRVHVRGDARHSYRVCHRGVVTDRVGGG